MTVGAHVSWPLVQFSIIGEAWRLYKRQWFVWSVTMLIVMVGYSVVNGSLLAILDDRRPHHPGGFRMTLSMGQGLALPHLHHEHGPLPWWNDPDGEQTGPRARAPDWRSVFRHGCLVRPAICSLLYGVATFIASMFCMIPGLIVSGLFMLGIPLVVDGRLPATGALIQSWNTLKSQWLMATVFHVILMLVAISGLMLCGLGVFLTGPLYSLSLAILYHDFFPTSGKEAWKKHAEPFPEI